MLRRRLLLAIHEPKTKHSGPRHQAAKLDVPDLLQVTDLAFGHRAEGAKLWEQSGQTLCLWSKASPRTWTASCTFSWLKPLDLGSSRSGGATWHLQMSEDGEFCRRKGRWLNQKVMELYVQEAAALLYLKRIPAFIRQKVLAVFWPEVLS